MRKLAVFIAVLLATASSVSAVARADTNKGVTAYNDAAVVPTDSACMPSHAGTGAGATQTGLPTTTPAPNGLACSGDVEEIQISPGSAGSSTSRSDDLTRSDGTSSAAPAKKYVPYNRLITGPDGSPCATTGYVEEGTTPPHERLLSDPNPREANIPITGTEFLNLPDYPPCPQQPLTPGQPAPVETAAMIAARYWEQVPLPKPKPGIAPGRAITGKLAFLETNGETSHLYTNSTLVGPLQIHATGTYTIDWGDGTTTGPHSFEGKPWPDGQITHDYLKVGSYNVVVTEKWTATWALGGESGTLRTLQTTGTITNFPVQQIQAVIGK